SNTCSAWIAPIRPATRNCRRGTADMTTVRKQRQTGMRVRNAMKTNHHSTTPRVDDIDPTFEPWEPPRPIPIFLLAVLIALALAGVGIYLSDLAPWTDSGSPHTVASGPVAPVTPIVHASIATP